MRAIIISILAGALSIAATARGEGAAFSVKPTARRVGGSVKIAFALAGPTDVEVAVLDGAGKVVRHLAAGALGGRNAPPEPLREGLAQALVWDGKTDLGAPAGPDLSRFTVRVRAGIGAKFDRFIGADPYNFGRVTSSAVDEDGNLYVLGFNGRLNQGHMVLRVFDKAGNYLREILPFPANLPKDALKDVARWDEPARTFRPNNRRNLNPDFYGQPGSSNCPHYPMTLVSASKTGGVVLVGKGRTVVLETDGAVRSTGRAASVPASPPPAADLKPFRDAKARLAPKEGRLNDWTRFAVDFQRDEVYVNDGVCEMVRYDGATGEGVMLKQSGGRKSFWAADVAVGYDGLLYFRRGAGNRPGITDFSGPFERYHHDLSPAPYPGGSHVLSRYIYGRYGVGYADRGIGIGPDGKAYITFMYKWVKYCTAGFGPDGKPLKGKYLQGKVGGGKYPPELTSAIIGPITAANCGLRVDLAGNIYIGLWLWPKPPVLPAGFEKDRGYRFSVGSVVRFGPEGGFMAVKGKWLGADPIDVVPRTPGAPGLDATNAQFGDFFVQGATHIYQGLAPFSHSPYAGNTCCVCRGPRFDLDRYGRLALPNAITNSVLLYDNAGNLLLELGRYGNFDSQWVRSAPGGGTARPAVAVPDIPLAWPTGAGFSEAAMYVLDTYGRRVVRALLTAAAEETCAVE